jgi:hypothetical protein
MSCIAFLTSLRYGNQQPDTPADQLRAAPKKKALSPERAEETSPRASAPAAVALDTSKVLSLSLCLFGPDICLSR